MALIKITIFHKNQPKRGDIWFIYVLYSFRFLNFSFLKIMRCDNNNNKVGKAQNYVVIQ